MTTTPTFTGDPPEGFGALLPAMRTQAPGPRSRELATTLGRYEAPTSSSISQGHIPVFWERTHGANILDVDGNLYIDLTAGFCVAVAGHSNPRVVQAIAEQAERMMHSQGSANPNPARARLAERLAELSPGDLSVSHIANTGAEAIEMSLKTARLYTGRSTIIAFQGGFHGKTTGALAVTAQNYYRTPFMNTLGGVVHLPYAHCYRCAFGREYPECGAFCADFVRQTIEMPDSGVSDIAAIILEPVQGHGGWIVPPPEFLRKLRQTCDDHDILLIADEIITGCGRTGRWLAIEHSGVLPDILAIGKGLASGFPISAMITRPEIAEAWKPLQHTSTFLGNPVGCAASLASLAEIESRDLVARSAELGQRFEARLREMQSKHLLIGDIRVRGSMAGIELVRDRDSKEPADSEAAQAVADALNRGVMATNLGGTYHNVIKMSPPLVITDEQLDAALDLLDKSLQDVA
jgi:4-aminobutyrate aminotransferase